MMLLGKTAGRLSHTTNFEALDPRLSIISQVLEHTQKFRL